MHGEPHLICRTCKHLPLPDLSGLPALKEGVLVLHDYQTSPPTRFFFLDGKVFFDAEDVAAMPSRAPNPTIVGVQEQEALALALAAEEEEARKKAAEEEDARKKAAEMEEEGIYYRYV